MAQLRRLLASHPIVAIIGARQVGKTTLSRALSQEMGLPVSHFDLEDPEDLARLADPKLALRKLRGLVVIDEIQRRPELFPVLRVLVDRPENEARFLILGSASPDLLRQSAESLAGRIVYHRLDGFDLGEVAFVTSAPAPASVGASSSDTPFGSVVPSDAPTSLWLRGGFPRSYLAANDSASMEWRQAFVRTFLERDIPQLGIQVPAPTLRRFWQMLAHQHGNTWNGAELARGLGVTGATARRYLDILSGALVVQQLQPWHANVAKRQVKAPKTYIADSGILHALLGLPTVHALLGHPKVGASWEGFVIRQLLSHLGVREEEAFFWGVHTGAELDLLVVRGGKHYGFEIKRTTAPRSTRSMRSALDVLHLERLTIVHAGEHSFDIDDRIRTVSIHRILTDIPPL